MYKKKILIIGSSKDIVKTFKYLFSNYQVTNLSFRKIWNNPYIIKYYDTIILSGFHYDICSMNGEIFQSYVKKYFYFILKIKKNCKNFYLISTSLNINISVSRVVYFYYILTKKISLYKNINILSFDTIIGHEKKVSGNFKVFLLNILNVKTLYYKKMSLILKKVKSKKKLKKIKFIGLKTSRSRFIDRILRIIFDLILLKLYTTKLNKKDLN